MSASAIIVTRGDVDLDEIVCSFPPEWEVIVWDNGAKVVMRWDTPDSQIDDVPCEDLSVYGRYAAIEHASHDLIYVQDDDVLHTSEGVQEIVRSWDAAAGDKHVVCNMPANFRHAFYQEHALVGFGACFHRDAPAKAFGKFALGLGLDLEAMVQWHVDNGDWFRRTCDIVFTGLTPRVLVDVPYEDMPWATAENRMWKQPTHIEERTLMRDLVLEIRD